jgi:hypothetical protein
MPCVLHFSHSTARHFFKPLAKPSSDRFCKLLPNILTLTDSFIIDFAFNIIMPGKDIDGVGCPFLIAFFFLQKIASCVCHAVEQNDILFCSERFVAGMAIRLAISFENAQQCLWSFLIASRLIFKEYQMGWRSLRCPEISPVGGSRFILLHHFHDGFMHHQVIAVQHFLFEFS